jgi:hypothetical protein
VANLQARLGKERLCLELTRASGARAQQRSLPATPKLARGGACEAGGALLLCSALLEKKSESMTGGIHW